MLSQADLIWNLLETTHFHLEVLIAKSHPMRCLIMIFLVLQFQDQHINLFLHSLGKIGALFLIQVRILNAMSYQGLGQPDSWQFDWILVSNFKENML